MSIYKHCVVKVRDVSYRDDQREGDNLIEVAKFMSFHRELSV
jgi:hypothetical protein